MKRYLYLALLAGMLFVMNSCITEPEYPHYEPWLCSINADGTGFRKIKKVDGYYGTTGFWDIYMTKDNRIIFYGERLWISETDTIRPVCITDNIYTLQNNPARLSQSPDGSKLYFASRDKNIHELNLNTMTSRQLTQMSLFCKSTSLDLAPGYFYFWRQNRAYCHREIATIDPHCSEVCSYYMSCIPDGSFPSP